MKRIILTAVIATIFGNFQINAQNSNSVSSTKKIDTTKLLEKRCQRLEAQLSLDEATAAKFTPLYKEYVLALKAVHPARCKRDSQKQCSDKDKIARIEKRFDTQQKMLDTQKKYFEKFKKILNARQLETLFCRQNKHFTGKNYGKHNTQCNKVNRYKKHTNCNR